jgi:antitoxin VapB
VNGRISFVPTLNIKDPEVYRLAQELARRRGTSMTGAVRQALEQALSQRAEERATRLARLREIGERSAREIEEKRIVFLTDDDLYDENGLPR